MVEILIGDDAVEESDTEKLRSRLDDLSEGLAKMWEVCCGLERRIALEDDSGVREHQGKRMSKREME